MPKGSKKADLRCVPGTKVHARSALVLSKGVNSQTFGSEANTALLTGTVDRVKTQTLANGRKLRYVVATYKYGQGLEKQETLALCNVHVGAGPADGLPCPKVNFSPPGLVPLTQTVIQPGNPVLLVPPVNLSKASRAALLGAQRSRWMVNQAVHHCSQVNASTAALLQANKQMRASMACIDAKKKEAKRQRIVTPQKPPLLPLHGMPMLPLLSAAANKLKQKSFLFELFCSHVTSWMPSLLPSQVLFISGLLSAAQQDSNAVAVVAASWPIKDDPALCLF